MAKEPTIPSSEKEKSREKKAPAIRHVQELAEIPSQVVASIAAAIQTPGASPSEKIEEAYRLLDAAYSARNLLTGEAETVSAIPSGNLTRIWEELPAMGIEELLVRLMPHGRKAKRRENLALFLRQFDDIRQREWEAEGPCTAKYTNVIKNPKTQIEKWALEKVPHDLSADILRLFPLWLKSHKTEVSSAAAKRVHETKRAKAAKKALKSPAAKNSSPNGL